MAERSIGVALSGGGHRATLFGLGSLLALADAGLNERIVSISSVSGGSIANGIVLSRLDLGTSTAADLERELREPITAIARDGVLLKGAPATRWYVRLLLACAVVAVLGLLAVVAGLALANRWIGAAGLAVTVAAVVALWTLFRRRSERTEAALDKVLLGNRSVPIAAFGGDGTRTIHHVICTTELQSGEPFYLSPRATYGFRFGPGAPSTVTLARAVQASAAVPGAFNPRRVPFSEVGLPGDGAVVLDDGGVYDNMADEWEYNYQGRRRQWPGLVDVQPQRATSLVVVNSSAGWDDLKPVPTGGFQQEKVGLMRAMDVQYDVSTAHRRRALRLQAELQPDNQRFLDPVFVQISRSPYRLADQLGPREGIPPDDKARRSQEALDFLDASYGRQRWEETVKRTSGIATTLARLGEADSVLLLEHGYVLTMVNVYVQLGLGRLVAPPRSRFVALSGGAA